ncbi:CLUMA_CG014119, isoform A [Clunio marinus]|uniref:CLUMA_CG014119, isoform A n=1 Tax=Clunio marinus TaxID=568069 RepID=A0A1J1IMU7_9DIPT|nr:CLUMA_CG014119, isoform A [Clunio marinus]
MRRVEKIEPLKFLENVVLLLRILNTLFSTKSLNSCKIHQRLILMFDGKRWKFNDKDNSFFTNIEVDI